MYLFSRRTRLAGGNGMAGVEWASSICGKVQEITGQEVQLWATVYSPGFGTMSWTSWFADLASLEKVGDVLNGDASYLKLIDAGSNLVEGGLDDAVLQPIYGEPDPEANISYVSGVQAVMAAGSIQRGLGAGIEIAQKAEAATGLNTMFMGAMTGSYGSVGWLTGYESLSAVEAAGNALNSNADFLAAVDASEGCWVEDAAVTQQTLYRRLA